MGMLTERLAGAEEIRRAAGSLARHPATWSGQPAALYTPGRRRHSAPAPGRDDAAAAGGRLIRTTGRNCIDLPREVPHAFRTTGTVPVRFLALTLPGGLLDIYDEAGVPAAERRLPDAGMSDADVARWLELAPRYGLRVHGPPIPEAEA